MSSGRADKILRIIATSLTGAASDKEAALLFVDTSL
jgi:hypothetical protein